MVTVNKQQQILDNLRKQIPFFKCISGCTLCCGPVPFSKIERKAIKGKKKEVVKGLSCPYECSKGCSIYEHRPIICRLFGVVNSPLMRCHHGFMPDTLLSEVQGDKILEVYMKELM